MLGIVPGVAGLHDVDDYPNARQVPGLLVFRYDAPLCFANAEDFRTRALDAVDAQESPIDWFLLNAEAIVELDITSADALRRLITELRERDVTFAMARVKQDLLAQLTRVGLLEIVDAARIYPTLPVALEAFEQRGGPGTRPARAVASPAAGTSLAATRLRSRSCILVRMAAVWRSCWRMSSASSASSAAGVRAAARARRRGRSGARNTLAMKPVSTENSAMPANRRNTPTIRPAPPTGYWSP